MPLHDVSVSVPTFSQAEVLTSESLSSGTYADLATAGPSVTVVVGSSKSVLVGWNVETAGNPGNAGVDVSGANTQAATDDICVGFNAATAFFAGRTYLFTGLNPGITTFKMRYRAGGGSASFSRRSIWAMAI